MKRIFSLALTTSLAAALGCSDPGTQTGQNTNPQGTGGVSTTAGTTSATGGVVSAAGTVSERGGRGGSQTYGGAGQSGGPAGATAVGGSVSNGGSIAPSGTTSAAGSVAPGGSAVIGGSSAPDGSTSTGGASSTGGAKTSGGTTSAAGSIAPGGSTVVAGNTSTGGEKTSGGSTSAGGTTSNGGAKTSGGTTSAGGSSSASGTTSNGGSPCSASPVTPNATQQTKNALCYLYSIYGKSVLSGQQEANWNDNPTDISSYAGQGLKTPAVHGTDFAYHSSAGCTGVNISTTHAIAHWNAGGLVMYRYHSGMPVSGTTCMNDCYTGTNCSESTPSGSFFTNIITPGTAENTSWNGRLDYMTVQFKAMAAANMPVILALFHETQSNGWFWWSKGTGAQFLALWKYSFNYLTATKGNTNIIWLMPYSGAPTSAYWPGPTMVDISGGDTYGSNPPFSSLYSSCKGIMGSTMPIALHECGTAPNPSTMFPTAAPWVLFSVWAGYETSQWANLKTIYADSHTITRDEIPSLK
jgi:hypothetical protein